MVSALPACGQQRCWTILGLVIMCPYCCCISIPSQLSEQWCKCSCTAGVAHPVMIKVSSQHPSTRTARPTMVHRQRLLHLHAETRASRRPAGIVALWHCAILPGKVGCRHSCRLLIKLACCFTHIRVGFSNVERQRVSKEWTAGHLPRECQQQLLRACSSGTAGTQNTLSHSTHPRRLSPGSSARCPGKANQ